MFFDLFLMNISLFSFASFVHNYIINIYSDIINFRTSVASCLIELYYKMCG